MLYFIATPLGNLSDLSERALQTLRLVDAVAAEDTRRTLTLLTHFGLQKPLFAFHQHNEREMIPKIVERLQKGENLALVSDAGYPCISDAGALLTETLRDLNLPYTCVPGPSAVDLALVLSGLPTFRFAFLGFVERAGKERTKDLMKIAEAEYTTVVYESPNRVLELLTDLQPLLGKRRVALLREMTKVYEECVRGEISQVLEELKSRAEIKGECVLVFEGGKALEKIFGLSFQEAVSKVVLLRKKADLSLSQAAQAVALVTGFGRKELYNSALELE